MACAATLLGFLGRFGWLLDLFAHFRVQYLVGLGVLAVVALLMRHRVHAACFATGAAVNLVLVAPLWIGGVPQATGPPSLRALLSNVGTRRGDPERVRALLREEDADVVVLLEVSRRWLRELEPVTRAYPHVVSEPREDNVGIALFSRHPIVRSELLRLGGAGTPTIVADLDRPLGLVTVIGTHAWPPVSGDASRVRDAQLADLVAMARRSAHPVLLLGDLNATPWCHGYRHLVRESGLVDSARGRGLHATWSAGNPLLAIPIDHCLHSPALGVLAHRIGPDVRSDHRPLIVDLVAAR
jgi:endonuclease/exonuclease/phosphatase (EEP) superfamily protein YafD